MLVSVPFIKFTSSKYLLKISLGSKLLLLYIIHFVGFGILLSIIKSIMHGTAYVQDKNTKEEYKTEVNYIRNIDESYLNEIKELIKKTKK